MAQIIWTEPALGDLNDIAEYIALSNPIAAQAFVKMVFEKVQRLEIFPDSGRIPTELEHFSYREVIANPCRIFYKVHDDNVFILYVMRQEQDLQKFLMS